MKSLKILLLLIFGIFLISSVSAVVVYGDWSDGTQITEIDFGENINFNTDFFSMNPPMTVNIKLYNQYGSLIHSFENNRIIEGNSYAFLQETYLTNEDIYKNPGDFELILMASDDPSSQTHILYLKVNPAPPEPNNPPVITSAPITEIDEGEEYSYQVTATDIDNDILTFSLTQKPSWLSISPFGLVTGTAPLVSEDTDYPVTIKVSDSKDPVFQNYILTVKNIPETIPDTTPPVITILGENPIDIEVFSDYADAGATAYDNVDGDLTDSIVTTDNVNTNVLGTYYVSYSVEDNSGNSETKTRTVNVVDTTFPEITLLGENPQIITLGNLYTELGATAEDNYDGDLTNDISIDISNIDIYVIGSYEIFYTVSDSSGNEAQVIRTLNVVEKESEPDDEEDGNGSAYSYRDVDEIKYFEQFTKPTPISYPEEIPEPEKETNWLILILIIGIIALIIVVALILISRLKY